MTTPVLSLHDLTVRYGDVVAVDGVDLTVEGPGITALVGPSGCGKTSILRAIAGFEAPIRGSVVVDGTTVVAPDLWIAPEHRGVGMVFQEGALFPHLTVAENVRFGIHRHADGERRVAEMLELVGLADLSGRFPDELSGGQKQRVALARALAPAPPLVLLDEPFAALDATLRVHVRDEVRAILGRAGATAVLVTHDQEEALSVADQVAVMVAGRVLQVGAPEAVYHRPQTAEVAELIGDGELVPCEVVDGRLRCAYGAAATDAGPGLGLVLVRPEDLRIEPGSHPDGLSGALGARRFYGHDLVDEVVFDDGSLVPVRSLGSTAPAAGSRVKVSLREKAYVVFRR